MLSKEECKQAINKWEKSRHNFEDVKKLIDPSAVFKFTEDNCKWIKENNDNEIFHCYVGVHNNILILIIMPLDKDGKEKIHLNQYITTPLTNLTEEITLIQIDVVTTVSKARLSKNLEIIKLKQVKAVGECGLDFNRNFSTPEIQNTVFLNHIKLGKETKLPLYVHERDAFHQMHGILKENINDCENIVVHCFTGTKNLLID